MSKTLKDLVIPPTDDLRQALRFESDTGSIWLEQQRMLLLHASALGSMRSELIESLGRDYARDIFMRMGWASAQPDAELARRIRSDADVMDAFMVGPQLHTMEGIVNVTPVRCDFDIEAKRFDGEFIWTNSFESQEHIRLFGFAEESVCWQLLGYASGYTSTFMGFPVFYKEVDCVGKGDKQCRIIGKPLDEWEDAAELKKLFDAETLAEKLTSLQNEVKDLREVIQPGLHPENLVADSREIQDTLYLLRKAAETDVTVLMLGETGVGKEVFSQALHQMGKRKDGHFIAVNCAALPRELIEAELFGVEKGAFTGADKSREGRFERADGGTLFLDELGELNERAQAKLLRVLQTGEFERVGGTTKKHVDVRLVAATNADLEQRVKEGTFRADLFYRLNVFPITIPPLRERMGDLNGLIRKFIEKHNIRYGKNVQGVTDETLHRFQAYHWPGNIRELENILERGVILADNNASIDSTHICIGMPQNSDDVLRVDSSGELSKADAGSCAEIMIQTMTRDNLSFEDLERNLLKTALEKSEGNVLAVARMLGITGPQCRYRLKKLDLL